MGRSDFGRLPLAPVALFLLLRTVLRAEEARGQCNVASAMQE